MLKEFEYLNLKLTHSYMLMKNKKALESYLEKLIFISKTDEEEKYIT